MKHKSRNEASRSINDLDREIRALELDDDDAALFAKGYALEITNAAGLTNIQTDSAWRKFAGPFSNRPHWLPVPRTVRGWVRRIREMVQGE